MEMEIFSEFDNKMDVVFHDKIREAFKVFD